MTTLAEAVAELDTGQSLGGLTAAVRDRTIDVIGSASGAEISGVMVSGGLLSLIEDQKNDAGSNSLLRNICLGLEKRFLPNGEVDLSDAGNVALLDAFLSQPEVTAILTAFSTDAATIRAAAMALATTTEKEFPGVREVDVQEVR